MTQEFVKFKTFSDDVYENKFEIPVAAGHQYQNNIVHTALRRPLRGVWGLSERAYARKAWLRK